MNTDGLVDRLLYLCLSVSICGDNFFDGAACDRNRISKSHGSNTDETRIKDERFEQEQTEEHAESLFSPVKPSFKKSGHSGLGALQNNFVVLYLTFSFVIFVLFVAKLVVPSPKKYNHKEHEEHKDREGE